MKLLITILFTFSIIIVHSQNYKLIDEKVKNYPHFNQIDDLVEHVNNEFNTDTEKVRAFYIWTAHNVTYDLNTYYSIRPPVLELIFDSESINKSIENQKRKKLAKQVFKHRKALCLGFSSLFSELCLKSNIEVELIEGIIKRTVDNIENPHYSKNHAWNAVKINEQWKLIDVTFASGFEDRNSGGWVKQFNNFYFFTDPEKLLSSHLPEKPEFQLISEPISTKAFFKLPIYYAKYFESGLELSHYQTGTVYVSKQDDKIHLSFKNKKRNRTIYYKFNNENKLRKLSLTKNNNDVYVAVLKYKSNRSKGLSLYYDGEKILDFKVKKQLKIFQSQ